MYLELKNDDFLKLKYFSFWGQGLDSESDMRFVYCSTAICHILADDSAIDWQRLGEFIKSSRNYDGGIGQGPGDESHGRLFSRKANCSYFTALQALSFENNERERVAKTVLSFSAHTQLKYTCRTFPKNKAVIFDKNLTCFILVQKICLSIASYSQCTYENWNYTNTDSKMSFDFYLPHKATLFYISSSLILNVYL